MCQDIGVSTETRLWAVHYGVYILVREDVFSGMSRPALGPIQLPTECVQGAPFMGVKWPEREAPHAPTSSAKVKSEWSYTSTPPIHLHGTYRDNFLMYKIKSAPTAILYMTLRCYQEYNLLMPNDEYSGCTTPLTSKLCSLYIHSTNIGTEYFKHGIHSPFFPLQNAVCFINLTHLVPVLITFYIQNVLKFKK